MIICQDNIIHSKLFFMKNRCNSLNISSIRLMKYQYLKCSIFS